MTKCTHTHCERSFQILFLRIKGLPQSGVGVRENPEAHSSPLLPNYNQRNSPFCSFNSNVLNFQSALQNGFATLKLSNEHHRNGNLNPDVLESDDGSHKSILSFIFPVLGP